MEKLKRWTKQTKIYRTEEDFYLATYTEGFTKRNKFVRLNKQGFLTIKKGYCWNGCSPKWSLFSMIFGTPEGVIGEDGRPITWIASLIHDALYQLKVGKRKDADLIFLRTLQVESFKPARLYYLAVRIFGGKSWKN